MEKITGNEPVTPHLTYNTTSGHADGFLEGLTIRQHFAINAPNEIPTWFKHTEDEPPKPPKHYTSLGLDENSKQYKILKNWHNDSIYDLPEEYSKYQKEWESYIDATSEYNKKEIENRYFQWRTYYADALINALNQSQP